MLPSDGPRAAAGWTSPLAALHDRLTTFSFGAAMVALAIIANSLRYEVVSRYFFNAPTVWASPFASYGLCASIFLAIPELTRNSSHIALNFLDDFLAPERALTVKADHPGHRRHHLRHRGLDHGAGRLERFRVRHHDEHLFPDPEVVALGDRALRHGELGNVLPRQAMQPEATPLHQAFFHDVVGRAIRRRRPPPGTPGDRCPDLHQPSCSSMWRACSYSPRARRLRDRSLASIFTTANTQPALAAVPLFILMGDILFRSGAMEVLFDSLDRLIGRIRGRQYVLCILLSAILGALSGAAMAVAGMLGRSLFPSMIRPRGYDTHLSVGTILGGASLDPIIPPSVLAIIIATLAEIFDGKVAGGRYHSRIVVDRNVPDLRRHSCLGQAQPGTWISRPNLPTRKTQGSPFMAVVRMVPSAFIFFLVMGLVLLGDRDPDGSGGNRRFRRGRARSLLPRICPAHA